ncbi:MAG: hypothetical protein IPJ82_09915 [Lewinellaceae bacterium]|nr:hypothetical protein [Lewinellaceae bacterium]
METAAQAVNYDFSGIKKPQNESDQYGLAYADFIPSLVKALQEQQAQIETQKNAGATSGSYGIAGKTASAATDVVETTCGPAINVARNQTLFFVSKISDHEKNTLVPRRLVFRPVCFAGAVLY